MKKIMVLPVFLLVFSINFLFAQDICFDCHGEKEFTRELESGKEQSLFVDQENYEQSVHGEFSCQDCHFDAEGDPHPDKLEKVQCETCHEGIMDDPKVGIHQQLLLDGDPDAPTCVSCHGAHDILSSTDENSRTFSVHLPHTCGQCHQSNGIAAIRELEIDKPYERFEKGVHGHALADGNTAAASCNDCHESHNMLPKSDPASLIYIGNISNTCGKCHEDIAKEYDDSIHGVALARGEFDSPTCTNCHGEHEILSPQDPNSPTNQLNLTEQTCAPCHGLPKLNEKYGFLPDVVDSYLDSYHGLASVGGSKVAANCTSCHGVHNIYSESDTRSTINPANLQETCGTCHINVNQAFTKSYIHSNPESTEDRIASIIKTIYIWLIIIVIGGMVLHNFIIWLSYVRAKLRKFKEENTIQRFDKKWVIQHVTTFVTFTLLVITGFALKYPDSWWVNALSSIGFTETLRGLIHRISAVIMLLGGVYHLYYLFFVKSWKGELQELLPKPGDVPLAIDNIKYFLSAGKNKVERPKFHKYGYIEKAEYWALIWGTVIMAFTGFVLWFPTLATRVFPAWIIKVSETVHFYEAILASLAILLYHMFFAIFHPEDYPINLTGFTGKISREEAMDRYPEWVNKLKDQEDDDE